MVSAAAKLLRAAFAFALLLPGLSFAQEIPDYDIGDRAERYHLAPAGFTIIDPEATENLRAQIAAMTPVYFRHEPKIAAAVEADFRKSFAAARERFLSALENHFATNRLDAAAAAGAPFQQFCSDYRSGRKLFPADRALLTVWARGESDAPIADALAARLRAVASQLCAANPPAEFRTSPQIRILTAAAPDLAAAAKTATELPRARLMTLNRAKTNLLAAFPETQQPAAKFLAALLQTNCAPEVGLSRQNRAAQTETVISAVQYTGGQLIVQRGEIITAKTKTALDKAGKLLTARAAADRERATQQLAARKIAAGKTAANHTEATPNPWPWLALGFLAPLTGVILRRQFRRPPQDLLPVRCAEIAPADEVTSHTEADWQRRALLAEQRAERATAIVRKGLLGQLANQLTNSLVKQLVSQRTELIAGQQQAVGEIEALAARLEKLEGTPPPNYYVQRIAALEQELASKNAENRMLLKARIEIAHKQMAEARRRTDWN